MTKMHCMAFRLLRQLDHYGSSVSRVFDPYTRGLNVVKASFAVMTRVLIISLLRRL